MVFVGTPRRARALATALVTGAAALAVAACGSSGSTSSTAAASGTGASSASARYQARLQLAKCLRAHGLNVPDPSAGGGPAAGGAAGGGAGGFRALRDSPNFQPAMQACAKYRRQAFAFGNLSPAQRAQFQQDLVKFAQCMRAHNIDIPDPSTSAGGGLRIFRQIPPSERGSPAFQSALQACSTTLPFRRGGGAGGAPGNPGA
jgi:hypothetical protein